MGFLKRCEEMEQNVEESFEKLVRAIMLRKEVILQEIQSIKSSYFQIKQRLDKQKEQCKKHLPGESIPLDNEVKYMLDKVGKDIEGKLEELFVREASIEELEIRFSMEKEFLLNTVDKLGCVLIENVQPENNFNRTITLPEKPLLLTADSGDGKYYVVCSGYYGITLNTKFDVVRRRKLENSGSNFVSGISINETCIYLSHKLQNVILVYDKQWRYLRKFGQFGFYKDGLIGPSGLCWHDSKLYVCDSRNNRIQIFKDEKHIAFIGEDVTTNLYAPLRLINPLTMRFNQQDELVVLHKGNPCFNVYSQDATPLRAFGSVHSGLIPTGSIFALTPSNEIVVSSPGQNSIQLYTENRNVSIRLGKSKKTNWQFRIPMEVVSLQDNRIVICDANNSRLCIFYLQDISLQSILY